MCLAAGDGKQRPCIHIKNKRREPPHHPATKPAWIERWGESVNVKFWLWFAGAEHNTPIQQKEHSDWCKSLAESHSVGHNFSYTSTVLQFKNRWQWEHAKEHQRDISASFWVKNLQK